MSPPATPLAALLLVAALAPAATARAAETATPDTLRFAPAPRERAEAAAKVATYFGHGEPWLRTPFGDRLLTDP